VSARVGAGGAAGAEEVKRFIRSVAVVCRRRSSSDDQVNAGRDHTKEEEGRGERKVKKKEGFIHTKPGAEG
jgi:hypothetical protein